MRTTFTQRELDIMAILWERGPSTAAEVRARLEDDVTHNTVLKMLTILEGKGHVGRTEEGRAHRYHALVARETAGRSALGRMLGKLFAGSPELLLTQLVDERGVAPDELARMRALLDARLDAAKEDA